MAERICHHNACSVIAKDQALKFRPKIACQDRMLVAGCIRHHNAYCVTAQNQALKLNSKIAYQDRLLVTDCIRSHTILTV